jgi:hypothetical protein
MRSIELVISLLADAIRDGKAAAPEEAPPPVEPAAPRGGDRSGGDRRRGSGRGEGIRGAVKQRESESKVAVGSAQEAEPSADVPQEESSPAVPVPAEGA